MSISISRQTARRYLLGRQGLWPGRRWTGKEGAAAAIHALESVQVDPVTIVARSHDLVLWSRVDGYDPEHLDELLYRDRRFFDYGGHLDIYPMAELPYWRLHMRWRQQEKRQAAFAAEHPTLIDEVREQVRTRGPLGNRDLAGNVRVTSYRARKDTGLALYYLWLTGELMTHSRRGFERLYDLRERVAPPEFASEATEADAERHFATKALGALGLGTLRLWSDRCAYPPGRRLNRTEARQRLDALVSAGEAGTVRIEGEKEPHYLPAADLPLLDELDAGRVPAAWQPLASTTVEEINLLSPLDNLLERRRTWELFGFEYLWEIYKPAARRRWGRYTMPILYGDTLVARLDPRLDRKTGTLIIDGFWLEDQAMADDAAFTEALARGLTRFAKFHAAGKLDVAALAPASLRRQVQATVAL